MNNQFNKFYTDEQWNKCIALALGWKYNQKAVFQWVNSKIVNHGILKGKKVRQNHPPKWSSDKNLWVEGSEVVEYMREHKAANGENMLYAHSLELNSTIYNETEGAEYSEYCEPIYCAKVFCDLIKELK